MTPKPNPIAIIAPNFVVTLALLGNVWLWNGYIDMQQQPSHDMMAGMNVWVSLIWPTPALLVCGLILLLQLKWVRALSILLLNALLPFVAVAIVGVMTVGGLNLRQQTAISVMDTGVRLLSLLLVLVIVTMVAGLIVIYRQGRSGKPA